MTLQAQTQAHDVKSGDVIIIRAGQSGVPASDQKFEVLHIVRLPAANAHLGDLRFYCRSLKDDTTKMLVVPSWYPIEIAPNHD